MESKAFIKAAGTLQERIRFCEIGSFSLEEEREKREAVQKDVNHLFSGLANPTLPSAFRLRDTALEYGFSVPAAAREKLSHFEHWSC